MDTPLFSPQILSPLGLPPPPRLTERLGLGLGFGHGGKLQHW